MPLKGITLIDGATAQAAPTGGSAITLNPIGKDIPNGIHVANTADASMLTRVNATFRNRASVKQTDGTYSKEKRSALIVAPKLLADGSYAYNLVRVETEIHPESTAAEIASLRYLGSQLLTDPDVDDFIAAGDVS